MDVRENLKYNILIFQICGLWKVQNHQNYYRIYSVIFFGTVLFLFPLSLAINLFYVDLIEDFISHSFTTLNLFGLSIKATVVIFKQNQIDLLMCSLSNVKFRSEIPRQDLLFRKTRDDCQNLVRLIATLFVSTVVCIAIVSIFLAPEERIWSSTRLIPIESLHHPAIYNGGLILQVLSNIMACIAVANTDTYGVALMIILRSLFHVTGKQLRRVGRHASHTENERDLIDICVQYEKLLR